MELTCLEDLDNDAAGGKRLRECNQKAATYFTAVDLFGSFFYENAQKMSTCDGWHALRNKYCHG
jgi:hypothetical protein